MKKVLWCFVLFGFVCISQAAKKEPATDYGSPQRIFVQRSGNRSIPFAINMGSMTALSPFDVMNFYSTNTVVASTPSFRSLLVINPAGYELFVGTWSEFQVGTNHYFFVPVSSGSYNTTNSANKFFRYSNGRSSQTVLGEIECEE